MRKLSRGIAGPMLALLMRYGGRAGALLCAALVVTAGPVAAQAVTETPASALSRHVRTLATQPRSYTALMGAGQAALELGDAQAAIGFFGRAEESYPTSPMPKAGTAAALVAMGEARAALGYFAEAQRLGANVLTIACDRGLAYDLVGDQYRAQADYRYSLNGHKRDEARRRLALSQAISGDRAGAMATLDPLLVRRDPAASRARAFVLALTGDVAGARRVVEVAMPGSAAHMEPFLRRLSGLRADQKAAAVHFGQMPPQVSTGVGGPASFVAPSPATPAALAPPTAKAVPLSPAPPPVAVLPPTAPVTAAPSAPAIAIVVAADGIDIRAVDGRPTGERPALKQPVCIIPSAKNSRRGQLKSANAEITACSLGADLEPGWIEVGP